MDGKPFQSRIAGIDNPICIIVIFSRCKYGTSAAFLYIDFFIYIFAALLKEKVQVFICKIICIRMIGKGFYGAQCQIANMYCVIWYGKIKHYNINASGNTEHSGFAAAYCIQRPPLTRVPAFSGPAAAGSANTVVAAAWGPSSR